MFERFLEFLIERFLKLRFERFLKLRLKRFRWNVHSLKLSVRRKFQKQIAKTYLKLFFAFKPFQHQ